MSKTPKELIELDRIERIQDTRRRVLIDAYSCGHDGWNDIAELKAINDPRGANLGISLSDLRDVLGYLEDEGLIEFRRRAQVLWEYVITSKGCQAYEGEIDWPRGVSPR